MCVETMQLFVNVKSHLLVCINYYIIMILFYFLQIRVGGDRKCHSAGGLGELHHHDQSTFYSVLQH